MSGNFFPAEYKSFFYREGDVLAYPSNGKFAVARILKVDAVNLAKGQSIGLAPERYPVKNTPSHTPPFIKPNLQASAPGNVAVIQPVSVPNNQPVSVPVTVTVTEDDSLFVVGVSLSDPIFNTFEETWSAFEKRKLKISTGHAPMRTTSLDKNSVLLGNFPVTEEELTGYRRWKEAFKKGEAGVF